MFTENKYKKWYDSIIQYRKTHPILDGYCEKHHILPRSLGGTNRKDNLVFLTAKEHYICHRLLTKFTEGEHKAKMIYAVHVMINFKNIESQTKNRYYPSSVIYQRIRQDIVEHLRTKTGDKNPFYGKTHTDQVKESIRKKFQPHYGSENFFHGTNYASLRRWMKKDGICEYVLSDEVEQRLKDGWEMGRVIKEQHRRKIKETIQKQKENDSYWDMIAKRKSIKGIKKSKETKEKMADSQKNLLSLIYKQGFVRVAIDESLSLIETGNYALLIPSKKDRRTRLKEKVKNYPKLLKIIEEYENS